MHPLDNPVWHALRGPQHTVAEGGARAARYPADIAPFAALPDQPDDRAWEALAELVGPGGIAALFREPISSPPDWERATTWPTVQMVGPNEPVGVVRADEEILELGPADVEEMLALVERTDPGPFARRTIQLGAYIGIRRGGALVAMAGERMHLRGHREISAVCTDPSVRGEGLGALLVDELVARITADDEVPFLGALRTNTSAIALYEALGFTLRRTNEVVALVAPPAS